MLIEGAGVVAHRSTPVPFFIPLRYETSTPRNTLYLALCSMQP